MKKDTAIILSILIFSLSLYSTDLFGFGGLFLMIGIIGFIGIMALLSSSQPLKNLTEIEVSVLKFEKKYGFIAAFIAIINVVISYKIMPFINNLVEDDVFFSISLNLGFVSLLGFLLGLLISLFPIKKMNFECRYKKSTIIGQLIVHLIFLVNYLLIMKKSLL